MLVRVKANASSLALFHTVMTHICPCPNADRRKQEFFPLLRCGAHNIRFASQSAHMFSYALNAFEHLIKRTADVQ